ncbi:hypothetical protein [Rhodopila sp.]|uniref:hypothetical protein n=1 Tax=Rhodopila sp. TaxID=2480087 RepID=UPI003D1329B1
MRGLDDNQLVAADPEAAVGQRRDLCRIDVEAMYALIEDDEIVAAAMHLQEADGHATDIEQIAAGAQPAVPPGILDHGVAGRADYSAAGA